MMCWHKWTKWENAVKLPLICSIIEFKEPMLQIKTCEKCTKQKTRVTLVRVDVPVIKYMGE